MTTAMNRNNVNGVGGFDETNRSSSYLDYPASQPFINDDYRLPETRRFKAFPESNRQAVMSALRGLQEKFRQLELDRSQAESSLRSLTTRHDAHDAASGVTRDTDTDSSCLSAAREANVSAHARDVHEKLDAAESRCELLERQLGCMRRMVQSSAEQRHADARWRHLAVPAAPDGSDSARSQQDKISELERVHLRLTATQAIAENKIHELEEQLRQEKHCRQMSQQQQSNQEARQMLVQSVDNQPRRTAKKPKKKRTASAKTAVRRSCSATRTARDSGAAKCSRAEMPEHYRLNLAGIPFIAGKSTTPSHSLAANFQEVLSLMKCHNTRLCRGPARAVARAEVTPRAAARGRCCARPSDGDLGQLLLQLEDEFGQLSFEHLELKKQLSDTGDLRLRDDLERERDHLVGAMEVKAGQIARLQRHRDTTRKTKKKTKKRVELAEDSDEVRGGEARKGACGGDSAGKARASLTLLKDLKKIQTTLRQDDVSWDD